MPRKGGYRRETALALAISAAHAARPRAHESGIPDVASGIFEKGLNDEKFFLRRDNAGGSRRDFYVAESKLAKSIARTAAIYSGIFYRHGGFCKEGLTHV